MFDVKGANDIKLLTPGPLTTTKRVREAMLKDRCTWDDALPKEADVVRLYESFEGQLFNTLRQFTTPISRLVEAVHALRANGVKIGSTTGYTREMIDIVKVDAAEKGMHQTAL